MAALRHMLAYAAEEKSEWAGIPMPLEGEQLVIEDRYPNAAALSRIGAETTSAHGADDDDHKGYELVNRFWSWRWRSDIYIWRTCDGKTSWGLANGTKHLDEQIRTLGCSQAWSIETEHNALHTLAGLLNHHKFKQYLLTGSFLETSQKSSVTYLFRKLRPTVAMSARGNEVKVLCALCLHPIAYYSGSWAGAMTPTDDVVAHLLLMRGDEHMFWRRANQHASWRPEAGL